jgi:uncharacterized membrane protein
VTTSRVEALSDGVFAIAMTLLIIEVHVPHVDTANASALGQALRELSPRIGAFVVSFLILGTLWIGHQNHFVHIRKSNCTLLWLNIGILCAIAFLPFSTAFLAEYWNQPLGGALYGINLLVAGVFLWLHWVYATGGRRLVASDLSDEVVHSARRRTEMGLAVYLVATVFAFLWLPISLILFAMMPIAYMLPGRVDRHLEQ